MTPAPTRTGLAARAATDGELGLAIRHWTGGVRLEVGEVVEGFTVTEGVVSDPVPEPGGGVLTVRGPASVWAPLLEAVPPRLSNDVVAMIAAHRLELDADRLRYWQYLPALQRAVELLRAEPPAGAEVRAVAAEAGPTPRHDEPVGRYVHLALDGADHRIYYEEAGQGTPLLLQHTAGANTVQWRHLFEAPEVTEHFRLIAYDLPFHGKSIPPVGRRWWEEPYRLTGGFLRQVPVALADALHLDAPVFMGCSVGGLLALDLALHHPDRFRAVISVEGALHVGGEPERLAGFWHPAVSGQSKARMMEGLCAPQSPEAYVKEVSQVYASGWPPAFLGDLHYYCVDYDLRDRAGEIDTARCAVHILNGEYDSSGTVELGLAAHRAIPGSTHTAMPGIGHFPMQEHPAEFVRHLLPVLDRIRAGG